MRQRLPLVGNHLRNGVVTSNCRLVDLSLPTAAGAYVHVRYKVQLEVSATACSNERSLWGRLSKWWLLLPLW